MVALLRIVTTLTPPLAFVTVSVTLTPVRVAVPQLETEPETVYEPVARSIAVGPQTLLTVMQAWLVIMVVHVPEILVIGPSQGFEPTTVKKSLLDPQLVTVMVCVGILVAAPGIKVPSGIVT